MIKARAMVLGSMILAAAASRLIPHPPNMASVAAIALFGGATISDKRAAFLVPLAALLLSDMVLGFYRHMEVVYVAFALIVAIGIWLQKHRALLPIAAATLASSLLFFLITNFGVWAFEAMYPKTLAGLFACYVAALPFLRNTLQGDVLYSLVLFGGFALLERQFRAVRDPVLRAA
jgi:hypothetical protein